MKPRCRWSILLVDLVATTLLFMITTILLTVQHNIPVWKSSTLATLMYGMGEDTREYLSARDLDSVEAKAKELKMSMGADGP